MERLAQVVIGPQAQAGHPVAGLPRRGQHEDHGPVTTVGDHLAQGVAVNTGQVTVEYHDVVEVEVELLGCRQTVVRGVHRHALVPQALHQDVGQRP